MFWEGEERARAISLEFAGVGDTGNRRQSKKVAMPMNVLSADKTRECFLMLFKG